MHDHVPPPARAFWLQTLIATLAGLLLALGAHASELAGEVVLTSGTTARLRPQQLNSPVRVGSAVHAGDQFRTGSDGHIELRMRDGARLSIGPDSEFQVDEYRFGGGSDRSFYSLGRGLLRTVSGAIGKVRHDEFRLRTPTAVMGIRGTAFTVEHRLCMPLSGCEDGLLPGERLRVSVDEGRVVVLSARGEYDVPAGRTLRLAGRDGVPVLSFSGPVRQPAAGQAKPPAPAGFDGTYQPILPGELGRPD